MWSIRYLLLGVLGVSVAQTVTIDPVGLVTVVEGNILNITCTDGTNVRNDFILHENGVRLKGSNTPPSEMIRTARIFHLPVDRTKNGNTYNCEDVIAGMMSAVITLTVTCECGGHIRIMMMISIITCMQQ